MQPSKNILTRVFLVVLLMAGIGYGISRYFSSGDVAATLRDKLVSLVREKSRGLYLLEIGQLDINAADGSASLRNILISVDSNHFRRLQKKRQLPDAIYNFTLGNLLIREVDILKLVSSNAVHLNAVTISDGRLNIHRLKPETGGGNDSALVKEKFIHSVRNAFQSVRIDTIHINQVDINYTNRKNMVRKIRQAHVDLYDFAIDSGSGNQSAQIFYSKALKLSIDGLSLPLKGNRYRLGSGNLVLFIRDSSITTLKDLYLKPATDETLEKFAGRSGQQEDVFRLTANEILLDNFDYIKLLEDSVIAADMVMLREPRLEIFRDKSLPASTAVKTGKYPHQVLSKLPFQVGIPVIIIKSGSIGYTEKNEKADASGKIFFENINGEIGPVGNLTGKKETLRAQFTAEFMGGPAVRCRFDFPESNNGAFHAAGNFAPFSAALLNGMAVPLGNTRLKSGQIDHLSFDIRGNDHSATGTTKLLYHDLTIEVLKKDPGESTYRKKGLLSALANELVLHDANRPGDRHADQHRITYRRQETKSMFNLIWKTVFYGVKVNTGVGLKGGDKNRVTLDK